MESAAQDAHIDFQHCLDGPRGNLRAFLRFRPGAGIPKTRTNRESHLYRDAVRRPFVHLGQLPEAPQISQRFGVKRKRRKRQSMSGPN